MAIFTQTEIKLQGIFLLNYSNLRLNPCFILIQLSQK
jgi:hypothetical protein